MFRPYNPLTRSDDYKGLDESFLRICGDYIYPSHIKPETKLTPSDVISLAMLSHYFKDMEISSFYEACLNSLLRSLKLPYPDLIFKALLDPLITRTDGFAIKTPLRIRANLIGFGDEFGNTVCGNPWLIFHEEDPRRYEHRTYVESVLKLKDWYLKASDHLVVQGIPVIDKAICDILQWDFSESVLFTDLKDFPDLKEAYDKYFCP